MVNYSSKTLDRSLYALSDPTRRAILARIAQGETTVSELAEPFDMSLAAISKHVQVLERAQFLEKTKHGRTITCKATLQPLAEVMELLEDLGKFWNLQLNSLEEYLASNLDKKEMNHEQQKKQHATKVSDSKSSQRKKR